ncbi:MAG TPA: hypothetical protein VFF06_29350 [Polyangia bacterium]|nr:hypothetical protein [Polyangia bacterium]
MTRSWIGLGVTLMLACDQPPRAFFCQADAQCTLAGVQGNCERSLYCSFPDASCADTGRRYGKFAAADLSQTCVGSSVALDGGADASPPSRDLAVALQHLWTSPADLASDGAAANDAAFTSDLGAVDLATAFDLATASDLAVNPPCGGLTQPCCAGGHCNALLLCLLGSCS